MSEQEKPRVFRKTLFSFAVCAGCGERHGYSCIQVTTQAYYGMKCRTSYRIEGTPLPDNCSCKRALKWVAVKGTKTDHVCDSRCTHAKGGDCQCSCGGANHGRG